VCTQRKVDSSTRVKEEGIIMVDGRYESKLEGADTGMNQRVRELAEGQRKGGEHEYKGEKNEPNCDRKTKKKRKSNSHPKYS
jgi:hypothetical protein